MQKLWAAVAFVRECPEHGLVVADPEQGLITQAWRLENIRLQQVQEDAGYCVWHDS